MKNDRILIVDDNYTNLDVLVNLLEQAGLETLVANNGERALQQVERLLPDLILLDVMMPGINGFETCRRLKINQATQDVPIIFMTALNEVDHKITGFELGAVDYITKPFNQQEVLARINTHLTIRRLQKKLQTSEAKLRALLEHAPEPTIIINSEGKIELVNLRTEAVFGYEHVELVGQSIELLVPEILREMHIKKRQLFMQMGNFTSRPMEQSPNLSAQRKDGTIFPVEVALSKVNIPDEALIIIYVIDITKRKQAEIALHRTNAILNQLANMDGLTQLANRRRFDDYLEQLWRHRQADATNIALILCDVDYFKQYNDTYGHLKGDDCLRAVANLMTQVICRSEDLVARYGGEEFAIILPYTDLEGATQIAQTIQQRIKQLNWPHKTSSIAPHITLSFGVASQQPQPEISFQNLIEKADKALYEAKNQGRNRVVVSPISSLRR